MQMRIQESNFSLFFPARSGIRTEFDTIEQQLQSRMTTPFTVLPIPDAAPDEFPRIMASGRQGYSMLYISKVHLSYQTTYDREYSQDWERCRKYLSEQIRPLSERMSGYLQEIHYQGLAMRFQVPLTASSTAELGKKLFRPLAHGKSVERLNSGFTYCEAHGEDLFEYTVQLTAGQARYGAELLDGPGDSFDMMLEVTDRCNYESLGLYRSSPDMADRLLEQMQELVLGPVATILGKLKLK